jgi:hypothetical protein
MSKPADRNYVGSPIGSGVLGLVDGASQLVEIGAEDTQEALERVPAHAPLAPLDTGHERGVGAKLLGDLFLGHPGLVAKLAEGSTEQDLVLLGSGRVGFARHGRNARVARQKVPGSFWPKLGMLFRSKLSAGARLSPPPAWHREFKLPAQRQPTEPGQVPSSPKLPPGASNQQEEPTMSTTLTVPAEIAGHLRCGLHMELGHAAEEIATLSTLRDRESYPDWYAEPLQQLDAARALLDAVGWSLTDSPEPVEIDLDQHRPILVAALTGLLEIERDLVDVDPSFEGAERQRKRASRAVREIEGFLADHDLQMPEGD